LLSNWRPSSLLNVDYKIARKAIANRCNKVINSIISNAQTGFLKNRYIGENIRLLFETIEYLPIKNEPGLLIFAAVEKASDIDHGFM
jgi:hypothetical protein